MRSGAADASVPANRRRLGPLWAGDALCMFLCSSFSEHAPPRNGWLAGGPLCICVARRAGLTTVAPLLWTPSARRFLWVVSSPAAGVDPRRQVGPAREVTPGKTSVATVCLLPIHSPTSSTSIIVVRRVGRSVRGDDTTAGDGDIAANDGTVGGGRTEASTAIGMVEPAGWLALASPPNGTPRPGNGVLRRLPRPACHREADHPPPPFGAAVDGDAKSVRTNTGLVAAASLGSGRGDVVVNGRDGGAAGHS